MQAINKPLTPGGFFNDALNIVPFGTSVGSVCGVFGRCAVSFFSPTMASASGTFWTFAGVGLIAAPLTIIPDYIVKNLLSRSDFLKKNPRLGAFLADTASFLIILGAVTAGAALLSANLPATLVAMMVVPTIIYALKTLCNVINACLAQEEEYRSNPALC